MSALDRLHNSRSARAIPWRNRGSSCFPASKLEKWIIEHSDVDSDRSKLRAHPNWVIAMNTVGGIFRIVLPSDVHWKTNGLFYKDTVLWLTTIITLSDIAHSPTSSAPFRVLSLRFYSVPESTVQSYRFLGKLEGVADVSGLATPSRLLSNPFCWAMKCTVSIGMHLTPRKICAELEAFVAILMDRPGCYGSKNLPRKHIIWFVWT